MTDGAPLIELAGLTRTYGEGPARIAALDGVDLRIDAGEFVAVMGPSGSGKSTLMNILGCLDVPTAGSYRFRGVRVETLSNRRRTLLRRYFLGFIFQGFNLLARTSALENVELPLLYRGVHRRERRETAAAVLAEVGLSGRERHTPAELSGGEQQRVAIARALVSSPELLLADEPTGNLDTRRGREIMDLMTGLNRDRGITVLMVTHDRSLAEYARRMVHLLDGQVERDEAVAEGR